MSDNHVFLVYHTNDNDEMRIQGTPEVVGRFLRAFLGDENLDLTDFGLANETEAVSWDMAGLAPQQTIDLADFYCRIAPESQPDQVLVITYYYQKFQHLEALSLSDYQNAYDLLRKIPVEFPSNLKSSVRNVVDRTEFLRNAGRGVYMLTIKGKEYVESLISEKSSMAD